MPAIIIIGGSPGRGEQDYRQDDAQAPLLRDDRHEDRDQDLEEFGRNEDQRAAEAEDRARRPPPFQRINRSMGRR